MDNSEYRTLNVIGVGTSGRGLKTLNNKNNLEDLYLKKKLVHYKREHTYSIAHLDRDRFDTHDFMKHILQIDSDSHPAAIQYLGRDPKKPTRQGPRRQRTAPGDSDQESDSEHQPTPSPVKTPNFNQARKSMMLPPTTQITLSELPNQDESAAVTEIRSVKKDSLPSLDRKKSIYLQIAAVTSKTEDNTCASSDSQSEHDSDNELFRSDGRKKSFMAWMQDQKSDKDKVALARIQLQREDPLVRRRNEFRQWLADRKEQRERTANTYSHLLDSSGLGDVNQLLVPQNLGSSNGMSSRLSPNIRQLPSFASVGRMVGNMGKVRKRPIKDRMNEFCKKCEDLKLENATIELTDAQIKRRWKMRTNGVRAALADYSDDDDEA